MPRQCHTFIFATEKPLIKEGLGLVKELVENGNQFFSYRLRIITTILDELVIRTGVFHQAFFWLKFKFIQSKILPRVKLAQQWSSSAKAEMLGMCQAIAVMLDQCKVNEIENFTVKPTSPSIEALDLEGIHHRKKRLFAYMKDYSAAVVTLEHIRMAEKLCSPDDDELADFRAKMLPKAVENIMISTRYLSPPSERVDNVIQVLQDFSRKNKNFTVKERLSHFYRSLQHLQTLIKQLYYPL